MTKRASDADDSSLPAAKAPTPLPSPYTVSVLGQAVRQERRNPRSRFSTLPGDMLEAMLIAPYLDSLLAPVSRLTLTAAAARPFSVKSLPIDADLCLTAHAQLVKMNFDARMVDVYTGHSLRREWQLPCRSLSIECATASGHLLVRNNALPHQRSNRISVRFHFLRDSVLWLATLDEHGTCQPVSAVRDFEQGESADEYEAEGRAGAMRRPGVFCMVQSLLEDASCRTLPDGALFSGYLALFDCPLGCAFDGASVGKGQHQCFELALPAGVEGADAANNLQLHQALFVTERRLVLVYQGCNDHVQACSLTCVVFVELSDGQPPSVLWWRSLENSLPVHGLLLDDSHSLLLYHRRMPDCRGELCQLDLHSGATIGGWDTVGDNGAASVALRHDGILVFNGRQGQLLFGYVCPERPAVCWLGQPDGQ